MYEAFKSKLISDFEQRRDIIVISEKRNTTDSLFAIRTGEDRIYARILSSFEQIAMQNSEELIVDICRKYGIACTKLRQDIADLILTINENPQKIVIKSSTVSMNSDYMHRLSLVAENSQDPIIVVFLLKDSIESRKNIERFKSRLKVPDKVQCILFEDLLEMVFGYDEKEAFQKSMINFKEELHKAVGYQVTELCSPYNLEKLRAQLLEEIKAFPYESIKTKRFLEQKQKNDRAKVLNDYSFGTIRSMYINSERYRLLLGSADFAESFLTSEWLYKKYVALDDLDNTFIIAGYLKSIEQLLWDIIFVIGKGRKIRGIEIQEANTNEIDKTLGSLQYFISDWENDDLYLDSLGNGKRFVMRYLKNQISDWRTQYRNGFFHKHNLKDKGRIDAIREETLFLYFLILGSIKLSHEQIDNISP